MRRLFAAAFLGLLLPSARAQDTTVVLPGVVVTATRDAAQAAATGRALRLDRADIARTGAATVAELLARRGGVAIRPYGPAGLASPGLRGTGAAQTLVLLDGFRLSDPQLGQADLSLLPTTLLARADVLHGAASAWHGTDAIGGALALTSRQPEKVGAGVAGEGGAWGLRGVEAAAAARVGGAGLLVAASHRAGDGDFATSTPAGPRRRANADFAQNSLLATLGAGALRGGLWMVDAHRGLPGAAGTQPHGERQHDATARLWLRATRPLPGGSLTAGIAGQRGRLRYQDPLLGLDETGRTQTITAEIEARRAAGRAWLVGGGTTYGFARATHPSLRRAAREHRAAFFGYAEGTRGRLHVAPALRLDAYYQPHRTRLALTPRLGVAFQIAPSLRLMASGATAFRVPTFNDRFWAPGGNPDLRPERAALADAGIRAQRGAWTAEVTGFVHAVRDQIVWDETSGRLAARNVGRVRAKGLEASLEWQGRAPAWRPAAGLFYTRTDARDYSKKGSAAYGQPLRYVPHEMARLWGGLARGAVALDVGLAYTGRRYARTDGQKPLDPFVVADVQVRAAVPVPGGRVDAGVALENALDARYSVLAGYPMPPRHLRFRLGYAWRP